MKELVCVFDNVYFNKSIYNEGDVVTMDDDLAKTVRPGTFVSKAEWDKGRKAILYKINSAKSTNKTIEDVIMKAEEEKKELVAKYEEKIKVLEEQINKTNVTKSSK